MAMEGISGSGYQDSAKYVQKSKVEVKTVQETGLPNIKIAEKNSVDTNSTGNPTGNYNGEAGQNDKTVTDELIKEAVSKVNRELKEHFTRAEFTYHKETKRISIKVIDETTDEVIREIPSEKTLEALELMTRMWNMAGLFVDEKR